MSGKREIITDVIKTMRVSGLNRNIVGEIVNTVFASIQSRAKQGERVDIRGFGTFMIQDFKEKKGRNPQTGEDIVMAPFKKLVLKAKKGVQK